MTFLRSLFNRPLKSRNRGSWIAGAILLAAFVILSAASGTHAPAPSAPVAATSPTAAVTTAQTAMPVATASTAPQQAASASIAAVRRAAKAFTPGYLAWAYGNGTADAIKAISPQMRARLTAPPKRQGDPKFTGPSRRNTQVSGDLANAIVFVDDGVQPRYPLALTLQDQGGAWLVVGVQ